MMLESDDLFDGVRGALDDTLVDDMVLAIEFVTGGGSKCESLMLAPECGLGPGTDIGQGPGLFSGPPLDVWLELDIGPLFVPEFICMGE